MRALIVALLMTVASSAQAAPWSFEMPPGYTEAPGIVDDMVNKLRAQQGSQEIDAQAYIDSNAAVQLTRIAWRFKMPSETSKRALEAFEWGVTQGAAKEAQKHISDSKHFENALLIGESIDENDGVQVHHRRLYALGRDGIVTLFWIMCAGQADAVGECTKAQQSMVLSVPDAQPITNESVEKDAAYLIGKIIGGVLVALIVVWFIRRRNQA